MVQCEAGTRARAAAAVWRAVMGMVVSLWVEIGV